MNTATRARKKLAILEYMANGLTLKQACNIAGISRQSAYDWRRTDQVFDRQILSLLTQHPSGVGPELRLTSNLSTPCSLPGAACRRHLSVPAPKVAFLSPCNGLNRGNSRGPRFLVSTTEGMGPDGPDRLDSCGFSSHSLAKAGFNDSISFVKKERKTPPLRGIFRLPPTGNESVNRSSARLYLSSPSPFHLLQVPTTVLAVTSQ